MVELAKVALLSQNLDQGEGFWIWPSVPHRTNHSTLYLQRSHLQRPLQDLAGRHNWEEAAPQ